jgi:hypothetical protein
VSFVFSLRWIDYSWISLSPGEKKYKTTYYYICTHIYLLSYRERIIICTYYFLIREWIICTSQLKKEKETKDAMQVATRIIDLQS